MAAILCHLMTFKFSPQFFFSYLLLKGTLFHFHNYTASLVLFYSLLVCHVTDRLRYIFRHASAETLFQEKKRGVDGRRPCLNLFRIPIILS